MEEGLKQWDRKQDEWGQVLFGIGMGWISMAACIWIYNLITL
jgi:hypothetical protein